MFKLNFSTKKSYMSKIVNIMLKLSTDNTIKSKNAIKKAQSFDSEAMCFDTKKHIRRK